MGYQQSIDGEVSIQPGVSVAELLEIGAVVDGEGDVMYDESLIFDLEDGKAVAVRPWCVEYYDEEHEKLSRVVEALHPKGYQFTGYFEVDGSKEDRWNMCRLYPCANGTVEVVYQIQVWPDDLAESGEFSSTTVEKLQDISVKGR